MAYSEKVLDHYENPRNVGSFDKSDTQVGTGMVGAPACGDVMKLQIKVDERGVIEDELGNLRLNTETRIPVGRRVARLQETKSGTCKIQHR